MLPNSICTTSGYNFPISSWLLYHTFTASYSFLLIFIYSPSAMNDAAENSASSILSPQYTPQATKENPLANLLPSLTAINLHTLASSPPSHRIRYPSKDPAACDRIVLTRALFPSCLEPSQHATAYFNW